MKSTKFAYVLSTVLAAAFVTLIAYNYVFFSETLPKLNEGMSLLKEENKQLQVELENHKEQIFTLTDENTHLHQVLTKSDAEKEQLLEDIKQKQERIDELIQEIKDFKAGEKFSVTATAYTAYCTGCSGTTYMGIDLRTNPDEKVIAVDPRVIPLGSTVWVEGYGIAKAADIGGAIKGDRIDIFIPSRKDALKFGVQEIDIRILSEGA